MAADYIEADQCSRKNTFLPVIYSGSMDKKRRS